MIDHITYWLIAAASWTMLVFGTFGLVAFAHANNLPAPSEDE